MSQNLEFIVRSLFFSVFQFKQFRKCFDDRCHVAGVDFLPSQHRVVIVVHQVEELNEQQDFVKERCDPCVRFWPTFVAAGIFSR